MALSETIIAELKTIGLAAFKSDMSQAGKSTGEVSKGAQSAAKDTEGAAKGIKGSSAKMAAGLAIAAGGAVIAKKAFGFMQSAADDAAALNKATIGLSRTTGFDAKTASGWVSMSKERGIQTSKLQVSLGTLSRRLTSAGAGSKTAAKSFSQLGLDANNLLALPPDLRMGMIADSFKALPDGANKTALAMQLFGRSGRNMIPIMNLGAKGIHEQLQAMDKYGLTIDASGIKKQKELIQSQREMKAAMEGVKLQIGQALIPILGTLAAKIVPVAQAFNQMITRFPALVPIIIGLGAAFATLMVIGSVAGAITAILPLLPIFAAGISAVWAAITGPIGLVVIAVAAVAAGFVLLYTKVNWFHNAVNAVWNWIKSNWPLLLGILTGPFGAAVALIITHFSQVKSAASSVISTVAGFFHSLPGKVAGVGRAIGNMIVNELKAFPGQALSVGKSIVDAVINGIKSAPGAVIDAVKSLVPGPLKKAVSFLTGATGTIVAAAGGTSTGSNRTVLVGENGPEVASMPSGTRITPLPPPMLSPSQIGGGNGGTIVTQVFLDKRQIATALASFTADQAASR